MPASLPIAESIAVAETVEVINEAPTEIQAAPTFIVDTERSVGFTNMDTYFDSNNPDENSISAPVPAEEVDEVDHITQLDHPPEPMDDFEDLEDGKIEFEQLS